MTAPALRPLTSRADLLAVTGTDDAFARLDPAPDLVGWAWGDTVAVLRQSGRRPPSMFTWGPDVGGLLDALIDGGDFGDAGIAGVSVPYDRREEIDGRFEVTGGGDWDWFWTTATTGPHPGSDRLVDLDDTADAEEIVALGRQNPRFEGWPGTGSSERWLGVRDDDGALIACGAVQRLPAGTAHLGGILVAERARRRGLGTAVSAGLTDLIVREEGVCTLGMYADNDAARALYVRLGYVLDKAWASRRVEPASAHVAGPGVVLP